MYKITLKNKKTFNCDKDSTIFEVAKKNNLKANNFFSDAFVLTN
jgi:hypothetical protein